MLSGTMAAILSRGRWVNSWGLNMPYGDIDLGQHWLRKWFGASWHLTITWTNVGLSSVRPDDIHQKAISQEIPQALITKIILKITYLGTSHTLPTGRNYWAVFCEYFKKIESIMLGWNSTVSHDSICVDIIILDITNYEYFNKLVFEDNGNRSQFTVKPLI